MNNRIKWEAVLDVSAVGYRHSSEKDYDKIVFSQAFRRLARKTQVHPLAQNDHVHNRMSHSIEVSSVCRSLVQKIIGHQLLPDEYRNQATNTIMAAGLGHDMGNPPFGHIGEESISKWISIHSEELISLDIESDVVDSYKSFDGNAQNFHLFNTYEYFSTKPVSYPTIATMVKYPMVASEDNNKSGYFSNEKKLFDKCFSSLHLKNDEKYMRHPLSYLLEVADDICYSIMDIDDAIEMDFFQTRGNDFLQIMKSLFESKEEVDNYEKYREDRGDIIEKAITEAANVFKVNFDQIMNGDIEIRVDLLKLSKDNPTLSAIAELKKLAANEVFKHRRKVQFETASYSILHRIFDNWLIAFKDYRECNWDISKCNVHTKKIYQMLDMYEPNTELKPKKDKDGLVKIIDFVSGCTDRYAEEISLAFLGVIK